MMDRKVQNEDEIDIVIPWVDGDDTEWRKERSYYNPETGEEGGEERYRDWGLMRYWFRGIEQFAPWIRRIHFITWGHLPKWLNCDHPKLSIVKHSDYLPADCLPTFNVNVIEWNLHRIRGLAEHFIYFNDDLFLLKPIKPSYFFHNGKPCDMLALQPVVANPISPVMSHIFMNNSLLLSKYFRKRKNMRMQPGSYFHVGYPLLYFGYNLLETLFPLYTGFYSVHGPTPMCKATYQILWEKEAELLQKVTYHRFRSPEDVNQYVVREWQKLSGNFYPKNITSQVRYFNLDNHNEALERTIRKQKKSIICINDAPGLINTGQIETRLKDAFTSILPIKSSFEKT